jgi:hypothetical protein
MYSEAHGCMLDDDIECTAEIATPIVDTESLDDRRSDY